MAVASPRWRFRQDDGEAVVEDKHRNRGNEEGQAVEGARADAVVGKAGAQGGESLDGHGSGIDDGNPGSGHQAERTR